MPFFPPYSTQLRAHFLSSSFSLQLWGFFSELFFSWADFQSLTNRSNDERPTDFCILLPEPRKRSENILEVNENNSHWEKKWIRLKFITLIFKDFNSLATFSAFLFVFKFICQFGTFIIILQYFFKIKKSNHWSDIDLLFVFVSLTPPNRHLFFLLAIIRLQREGGSYCNNFGQNSKAVSWTLQGQCMTLNTLNSFQLWQRMTDYTFDLTAYDS